MAKRFAGFTPEQMGKIIPEMKGMQADEQAKFLASQPGAAARVGKIAELAQKRIGMANGGYAKKQGYADGGNVVGKGGKYFIKDAQGGYSQSYDTALDAYYANKGQSTNPSTGAEIAPYNVPNTTGGFDMGIDTPEPVKQPGDFTSGPVLPVEPKYDPSKGLPTAPEGITEADYAPFL